VYGDDIIIPWSKAREVIEALEFFGLRVNRDKSCLEGSFAESCGVDAFKGVNVTPTKIKSVWANPRTASEYASWISYANSFYRLGLFMVYEYIVELVTSKYGRVPFKGELEIESDFPDSHKGELSVTDCVPMFHGLPIGQAPLPTRWSKRYQKRMYLVNVVTPIKNKHSNLGWTNLLRYFTERGGVLPWERVNLLDQIADPSPIDVYTPRGLSVLKSAWR